MPLRSETPSGVCAYPSCKKRTYDGSKFCEGCNDVSTWKDCKVCGVQIARHSTYCGPCSRTVNGARARGIKRPKPPPMQLDIPETVEMLREEARLAPWVTLNLIAQDYRRILAKALVQDGVLSEGMSRELYPEAWGDDIEEDCANSACEQ